MPQPPLLPCPSPPRFRLHLLRLWFPSHHRWSCLMMEPDFPIRLPTQEVWQSRRKTTWPGGTNSGGCGGLGAYEGGSAAKGGGGCGVMADGFHCRWVPLPVVVKVVWI
ncbi:hypothetical protein ACP275_07G088900 [Erythranthe tilingii]